MQITLHRSVSVCWSQSCKANCIALSCISLLKPELQSKLHCIIQHQFAEAKVAKQITLHLSRIVQELAVFRKNYALFLNINQSSCRRNNSIVTDPDVFFTYPDQALYNFFTRFFRQKNFCSKMTYETYCIYDLKSSYVPELYVLYNIPNKYLLGGSIMTKKNFCIRVPLEGAHTKHLLDKTNVSLTKRLHNETSPVTKRLRNKTSPLQILSNR
jgi:hypothetical protein